MSLYLHEVMLVGASKVGAPIFIDIVCHCHDVLLLLALKKTRWLKSTLAPNLGVAS